MNNQKLKVYIAGKIGGLDTEVYTSHFKRAELALINEGFEPVNPVSLPHNHSRSWKAYMSEDLKALKECCALLALNNWRDSRGARIEVWFAKRYNIKIVYEGFHPSSPCRQTELQTINQSQPCH